MLFPVRLPVRHTLPDEQLARPIFYPWPRPETRNLLWVAAQALHEAEHHLTDVQSLVAAQKS